MKNGEYELVETEDEIFFWRRCVIENCEWLVCLGASDQFCYLHAMEDLIQQQIYAINKTGYRITDNAHSWCPKSPKEKWKNDTEAMEQLLLKAAELEVNYVGPEWKRSAMEIIRRIEIVELGD